MINRQGFAATSIDKIIERAGVTKGTFFYHFETKNALALALIDRFAAGDQEVLRTSMDRAEKLSNDPLQQVLIFVGLILEVAEELDGNPTPGCLFATYCFESGLFDDETNGVISSAMGNWKKMLGAKLRAAAEQYPMKMDVDLDDLANLLSVIFEGAFVMSRIEGRGIFVDQLGHYKKYLELLFDAQ